MLPKSYQFKFNDTYLNVSYNDNKKNWNVLLTTETTTQVLEFEDGDYLNWIRNHTCVFENRQREKCNDIIIQIHHEPPKMMGGREDDLNFGRIVPLCPKHHEERTMEFPKLELTDTLWCKVDLVRKAQNDLPIEFLKEKFQYIIGD